MSELASQPRFVSIEGGEGAGKSTVINALRAALEAAGERVIATREGEMDAMTVQIESRATNPAVYEASVLEALKLRGRIEIVTPGTLPNDGKVIEDRRTYG